MAHTQPRTLRIIVADDNDHIRNVMISILQNSCAVIDAVATGRSLVASALALKPDVIVSDVSMPLQTGIEAMAALRAAGWNGPFVLVTAGRSDPMHWINLGALAVVDKADLDEELVRAVRSAAAGFSYLSAGARRSIPG